MLEIKNFESIKGIKFLDWAIYVAEERKDWYEFCADKKNDNGLAISIKIFKEPKANNEYNVSITYRVYTNEIYNQTWVKGGFDTIQQFLTNVGLIVSNYEKGLKTK